MGNSMQEEGIMADNFEKHWGEAFDNMDAAPSSSVWEGIDRSLANSEVSYYKKKAVVYKWAAIAAIVFAVSITIPRYFKSEVTQNGYTAGIEPQPVQIVNSEQYAATNNDNGQSGYDNQNAFLLSRKDEKTKEATTGDYGSTSDPTSTSRIAGLFEPIGLIAEPKKKTEDIQLAEAEVPDLRIYQKVSYAVLPMQREQETRETKKYWAGLGVGSSTFDPNYQLNQPNDVVSAVMRSQPNFVNSSQPQVEQETSFNDQITEGVNYQLGVNMGLMMGKRLSLESGFSLAEVQLTSQTNLIIENKIFAKSVAMTSEIVSLQQVNQVTSTQDLVEYERADISLDNNFQFASIPLKAGYLILDKKVHLKLNAGLVTNIYLGNTLTDQSNQVASMELFPGDASPYRTVSFSSITGVSIGYNFYNQFDLMVEPNFSQALQPLTKEESNFNATPNGFGMMAGLRYRFGN